MSTDRREFLGAMVAAGLVAKKGSSPPSPVFPSRPQSSPLPQSTWDVSWTGKITGAGAVTLAMNDAFWAQYELTLSGSTAEKPNIPKRNPQMAVAMADPMGSFPPSGASPSGCSASTSPPKRKPGSWRWRTWSRA